MIVRPRRNDRLIIPLKIQTVFLFEQKKNSRKQAEILRKCQASAAVLSPITALQEKFFQIVPLYMRHGNLRDLACVMKHPEIARHAGKKSTAIRIVPFRQPYLTTS